MGVARNLEDALEVLDVLAVELVEPSGTADGLYSPHEAFDRCARFREQLMEIKAHILAARENTRRAARCMEDEGVLPGGRCAVRA